MWLRITCFPPLPPLGGTGSGSSELQQLVLVLADGRFHEKEGLRQVVREAAAKAGVCLAFIVLDNPANSLIDMQVAGGGGGRGPGL